MGISKFFNYLKKNYNNPEFYFENKPRNDRKTWDYLFMDYQSLFYNIYDVFSEQINYIIRLFYYISQNPNTSVKIYKENYNVIQYVINKYKDYFTKLLQNNIDPLEFINNNIYENIKHILTCDFNNNELVISSLAKIIVDYTKYLSSYHINGKSYSNTYIFFDGIPTLAKIKEQLSRRIYPVIMNQIKNNMNNNIDNIMSEENISKKLITPISIGYNTPIVLKVRLLLSQINDKTKGQFNINDIDILGEAEHIMMSYITKNNKKFFKKKILLQSPDADLILLSMISSVKNNVYIDIFRNDRTLSMNNNNISFRFIKLTSSYIYIDTLQKNLKFNTKQRILDISYLLLLLGDDFIPIIPTLSVNNIKDIINTYDNLTKKQQCDKNMRIIQEPFRIVNYDNIKYKLEYNNVISFIILLSKNEDSMNKENILNYNSMIKKRKINDSMKKIEMLSNFYFYNNMNNVIQDYDNYIKFKMLEEGYIYKNNNFVSLFKQNNSENKYNNEQIMNYLEGYMFIFDIYMNDMVMNYKWVYRYNNAPTLNNLKQFFTNIKKENIQNVFNYNKEQYNNVYLDSEDYTKYINDNKINLHKQIINNIQEKSDNDTDIDYLMKKYYTYMNANRIFDCNNKQYFNKCLELGELLPLNEKYITKKI